MARPLKMFVRGKSVSILQEMLRNMGFPMDDSRGIFGVSTRAAVKVIQKQRGLKVTGEVDDALLQSMQQGVLIAPAATDTSQENIEVPVNQQQLHALIRMMIRKGLIEEGELETEMMRSQAQSMAESPLM